MARLQQYSDSWHLGVLSTEELAWPSSASLQMAMDQTVPASTPRAWNNTFGQIGARFVPVKRPGCQTLNTTVNTASAVIGQTPYWYRDTTSGDITQYHVVVKEDGVLSWMNESGEETVLDASAFTPGFYPPDFAQLSNLLFIANGQERIKLNATTVQTFGIVRPEVGTAAGNAGAPGNLNGEYEIRFTFYNSVTGHESSASDTAAATVVCAFAKIDLTNIPTSSDAQVDTVYVYIRNIANQTQFYRVGEIVEGTTTGTVDAPDAGQTALVIQAPSTTENEPPPAGIKYLAAHKNRLFAADDGKLYWSKLGKPEAFDLEAFDFVHQDDGQRITGLASLPGGFLLILKDDSYYILEGDTPGIWQISKAGSVGCLSHRSVQVAADGVYWWAEQGPIKVNVGALSDPQLIGSRASATLGRKAINFHERQRICAAVSPDYQRVFFSVPEVRQERNTKMLVWSMKMSAWESDRWDPLDAASLTTLQTSTGEHVVMLGGYAGQIFRLETGKRDGIVTGTVTGSFTASATSQTSLTVSGATFDTAGGALVERKITILDSDGTPVTTYPRPHITSNTGTVLNFTPAVSGLTVGGVYTVIVGGPDWQFDQSWQDADTPFSKKRLTHGYLIGMLHGANLLIDVLYSQRSYSLKRLRSDNLSSAGDEWNSFDWNDGTLWNSAEMTYERFDVGLTGANFAFRFRNPYPDQAQVLMKVGMSLDVLDDKLG